MKSVSIFYVLTLDPSVTPARCRAALDVGDHVAEIKVVSRLTDPCTIVPHSLVVIDVRKRLLADPPVLRGAEADIVVVVATETPIPVGWLEFLRRPDVQIMRADQDTEACLRRLGVLLRPRFVVHRERLISAVVAGSRAILGGLEREVRAILSDPWGIRSPAELAARLGTSTESLAHRAAPLGLHRLEHLLTLVRWLAFEHLIGRMGFKTRSALAFVGMRDRSNFRRQWKRARYLVS